MEISEKNFYSYETFFKNKTFYFFPYFKNTNLVQKFSEKIVLYEGVKYFFYFFFNRKYQIFIQIKKFLLLKMKKILIFLKMKNNLKIFQKFTFIFDVT